MEAYESNRTVVLPEKEKGSFSGICVCVGQRDRKDTVGVDHLGVLKL